MQWEEEAIVLAVRAHGEGGAIVETLTVSHGRHAGFVHGGGAQAKSAALQPGNSVQATWRARLVDHLGFYTLEVTKARAGLLMEERESLSGLNATTALLQACLPERAPYPSLFAATTLLLDAMTSERPDFWGALYVRWELGVLEALGFGLDLTRCAATGSLDDLRYVSPRSGRAVCEAAGRPYANRLLPLPAFLLASQNAVSPADVAAGLRLTAHFLRERVLLPQGKDLPPARQRLAAMVPSYRRA